MKTKRGRKSSGLYRPSFEKDSCGIGFIAHLEGVKSHSIILDSLLMLSNMEHRGGCGFDENSGDGAGILIQLPHEFFVSKWEELSFILPSEGTYGVGMTFFPKDTKLRKICKDFIEISCRELNFELLGYRKVPINPEGIGLAALIGAPEIEQLFLRPCFALKNQDELERKLYVFRKYVTHKIHELLDSYEDFLFGSLSSKTLIYKGQLTTHQVNSYFLDLRDPEMRSSLALVHSRFSTNTFPSWKLSQPFRYMAHNGEINTIKGNVNWMKSKETLLETSLFTPEEVTMLLPIVDMGGSDSANLDNVIELLYQGGRSLPHAIMMLIPEAWQGNTLMEDYKKAFYEYHDCITEPWDGPASICFTDGKIVGATLDRNGLRPSRYLVTKDRRVIMSSEAGAFVVAPEMILQKGRLQPGKMFIADLEKGRIISDEELKRGICNEHPYREWLVKHKISFSDLAKPDREQEYLEPEELLRQQLAFGITREEIQEIFLPMIVDGKEPISSMGNDAPLAILSDQPQNLANYFKQLFAQVTNPPIDPIREKMVMANYSILGGYGGFLSATEDHCKQIQIHEPILTDDDIAKLRFIRHPDYKIITIHTLFAANGKKGGLERAINRICKEAQEAVENGNNIIILSDKGVDKDNAPIPTLLITGAVHNHLVNQKIRIATSIIIESGDIREIHHMAAHIAYGASAIYPYLAYQSIYGINHKNPLGREEDLIHNFIKAASSGLMKVFSKMGISTFSAYHGSQTFEIIGLNKTVVEKCFKGTESRLGGLGFDQIAWETLKKHSVAFSEGSIPRTQLTEGGVYQWKRRGEEHLFNPESVHLLQYSTSSGDYGLFKKYTQTMDRIRAKAVTLRNLMDFNYPSSPIPLEEVEPIENILPRFATGAMSFGSISHEAHTTLAIAMNRIGAKSNSGEGGEDDSRYTKKPNGDWERSAIKQVASARFGVNSHYLTNAAELQIKMAQGAKPGEGGQLPGDKVDEWIGRVRYSTPGVGLISPPPHHDIYSIEDLAQLIFDLKNANPLARISVKLVSEAGVGTVAAGVAKAKSEMILIAGHDGGTGASPVSSIRHAGMPWEIGLAEAHQTLVLNKLRNRVTLQTDGQIRTGKDLAIATLLGAEEWGIATAALVATGCIMMRKCHLNTCPVGIATQDPDLRKNYKGKPEQVIQLLQFLAQELREVMAQLGFRTINEMVGQSQFLKKSEGLDHWKYSTVDLSEIFFRHDPIAGESLFKTENQDHKIEHVLDRQMIADAIKLLEIPSAIYAEYPIRNTDRAVGAMISNQISLHYGKKGLPPESLHFKFRGSAGQSFGAFSATGLKLELEGEANDYVGKGLSGATLLVYPDRNALFKAEENIIIGNVALYGATSGTAFIRGMAGERFCVRNSGAIAVVESVGDHGCEYMTGGRVLVLGKTGRNFAAGMSGGIAYVYDSSESFYKNCNLEMVELEALLDEDESFIKALLTKHNQFTKSNLALNLLENWENTRSQFVKVMPTDYKKALNKSRAKQSINTFLHEDQYRV